MRILQHKYDKIAVETAAEFYFILTLSYHCDPVVSPSKKRLPIEKSIDSYHTRFHNKRVIMRKKELEKCGALVNQQKGATSS